MPGYFWVHLTRKEEYRDAQESSYFMKDTKGWVLENVISLGTAILLVLMVRSSIIEAYKIPSGSMIPTLLVGDHIFVNKFSYGWKIPFSDCVSEPKYITGMSKPERGDIIVFIFPRDTRKIEFYHRLICPIFGDPRTNFIKRVVGLPGDVIEVRNKVLYVNNKEISHKPVDDEQMASLLEAIDMPHRYNPDSTLFTLEHFADNEPFVRLTDKNKHYTENLAPVTVPEGHYFVMGDNRDYSNDSRFWGFVPENLIKGKAVVIWASFHFEKEDGEYPSAFRPSRTGSILY